jgi:hypothetical protein
MQETENAILPEKEGSWLNGAKKMTKPMFNILLVILFFLLAVRPFKKWLTQTGDYIGSMALPQGGEVPQLSPTTDAGETEGDSNHLLTNISKSNPDVAAEIIRSWISEDE